MVDFWLNCILKLLFFVVSQGLFLGSVGAAHNKDQLKKLNITHILTIACSLPPADPNDFVYKVVGGMLSSNFYLVQLNFC